MALTLPLFAFCRSTLICSRSPALAEMTPRFDWRPFTLTLTASSATPVPFLVSLGAPTVCRFSWGLTSREMTALSPSFLKASEAVSTNQRPSFCTAATVPVPSVPFPLV